MVWEKRRVRERKSESRKKWRRRRTIGRAPKNFASGARDTSRAGELVVGTYDVRTLVFKGSHGIGHPKLILKICKDVRSL